MDFEIAYYVFHSGCSIDKLQAQRESKLLYI